MEFISGFELTRNYRTSAGIDLPCAKQMVIRPGIINKIPTGVRLAIPPGMYGKIEGRSGLAARYGARVLAGVIDSEYRGEIVVLMQTDVEFEIGIGSRCAQIIISKYETPKLIRVSSFNPSNSSARGDLGFGSSGL